MLHWVGEVAIFPERLDWVFGILMVNIQVETGLAVKVLDLGPWGRPSWKTNQKIGQCLNGGRGFVPAHSL